MSSLVKYKVVVSDEAKADIENLFSSLAKTREDAYYAEKLIDRIISAILSLTFCPKGNPKVADNSNFYVMHVKRYKIIYGVHDASMRVIITNIMRSSQEWPASDD